MCNECKKEIKYLKGLIGVDGEEFLESHGFSTILGALSYLLTKVDQPNARLGAVRPREGYFEPADAVSTQSIPAPHGDLSSTPAPNILERARRQGLLYTAPTPLDIRGEEAA